MTISLQKGCEKSPQKGTSEPRTSLIARLVDSGEKTINSVLNRRLKENIIIGESLYLVRNYTNHITSGGRNDTNDTTSEMEKWYKPYNLLWCKTAQMAQGRWLYGKSVV